MSMAYLFYRFVCGVTPYLPNSHRTSIGIQSFRPKPAPFSSSSTSQRLQFPAHSQRADTPSRVEPHTRARTPRRDAELASERRGTPAGDASPPEGPRVPGRAHGCMHGRRRGGSSARGLGGGAAAHRRVARRIQGGARGDRAPEHDRPARGVDDSVRGRSRAHGPAARDVGRDAGIDDARADALRRVSRVGAEVREAPGVLPRRIRSVRRVPQARGGVEDKRAAHRGTQQALGYVPTTHPSTTDTQPHEPNRQQNLANED